MYHNTKAAFTPQSYTNQKDVWKPAIGEKLHAEQKLDNAVDKVAVKLLKNNETVGHLSHEYSKNISLSCRTCEFRKAHRIICCFNSLLKGLLGFCDFEFSLSQLINIHEKIGTREKSPDNRKVRIIEVRIIEVRLYL